MEAKNSISLNEWLELHPYGKPVATDSYYLSLANNIHKRWMGSKITFNIPENILKRVSMYVASYFEDVISGFGLWRAFINRNKDFYGKWLPIYDCENDYYEDEINRSDVQFIIWYSIQQLFGKPKHTIFPPHVRGLNELANNLYQLLDGEYESAPANEHIAGLFGKEEVYKDFFVLKQYLNWLFAHSYLLEPSTTAKVIENHHFVQERFKEQTPEQKNMIMYGVMQDTIFLYPCGPLSLHIKEWLCAIVGKDCPNFENYRTIEAKPALNWAVESIDEENVNLSCLQKDDFIAVPKGEFQNLDKMEAGKSAVTCGFVRYAGVWNTNGVISISDIAAYKNVQKANPQDLSQLHKQVYDKFLAVNNGKPIAYMKDTQEVADFLTKKMGWPDNNSLDNLKGRKNFVLYASEDKGIMIAVDIAELVKDTDNPMYNEEEAKKKAFFLFVNKGQCPIDLLEYLEEEGKLPDAHMVSGSATPNEEEEKALLHDNWDFIARLFLNEMYWAQN